MLLVLTLQTAQAQEHSIQSPDDILAVTVSVEKGLLYYSVDRLGVPLINTSRLGIELDGRISLAKDLNIASTDRNSYDETWEQVWGEKRYIQNNYNELRINATAGSRDVIHFSVVFRVYDDGLGFRYEIPDQSNISDIVIIDEKAEFAIEGNPTAWWIEAYQSNRYEYLYEKSLLDDAANYTHTPLTMETGNGTFISIHEAALTDYSSMTLRRKKGNVLEVDLVPWSDGTKVFTETPMMSPWRTIQVGDTAGDLVTSYLILNLNEPNKLADTSWIHPAKYIGIWWEMHLGVSSWSSGPDHGATTEHTKEYIDFAAEHGFDGVLVEGWNVGWDGDWVANGDQFLFTTPYPDFDIDDVTAYAASKGVRLIGHHETGGAVTNYVEQMDDAFAYYNSLGVNTVKTGYVAHGRDIDRVDEKGSIRRETHHGQYMVEHYRDVVEAAARHNVMINVHEPIKPTGIRRTYPNMLTREGARGQEYSSSWGSGNGPDHTLILPFTRLLAGPMDFTPGTFQLVPSEDEPENSVQTTLAKQLALYVTIYSPLQMASDLPRNYLENLEAFQFIKDVPVNWEDTRVIHADIGNYYSVVRKDWDSDEWFLGSITDEEGRVLRAQLDFLDEGRQYVAEIYADSKDAHWDSNPLGFRRFDQLVNSRTSMNIRLAPGGGMAVRFRPATAEDITRLAESD
ncbi:MAG: glycoside hydrolase family 97 protein [Rhodothermales bacterium]|nr:glycoside hydrolase family 97 protein [Rhodothermales bacterium]